MAGAKKAFFAVHGPSHNWMNARQVREKTQSGSKSVCKTQHCKFCSSGDDVSANQQAKSIRPVFKAPRWAIWPFMVNWFHTRARIQEEVLRYHCTVTREGKNEIETRSWQGFKMGCLTAHVGNLTYTHITSHFWRVLVLMISFLVFKNHNATCKFWQKWKYYSWLGVVGHKRTLPTSQYYFIFIVSAVCT